MPTPFAGRRPQYVEQYARTISAYQRYQDIARDIASEQDRLNYLDSLIQSERQNLTNLSEVFRVRPQDLGSAQALLQQQYAGEDAARRRAAAGQAGRAAGLQLPREARAELTAVTVGAGRAPQTARDVAMGLITADTTPEQGAEIVRILEAGQVDEGYINQVRQQLEQVARGKAPSGAPRALSPEEAAAEQALQQQLEAAFFAGPAGIRGGYDGQAIVERRQQTPAPKGVNFSTEQDAFEAALQAMADGVMAVEDFASEEDYRFAKSLYDEAKAKKAYRNDQRVNFEPEVLASRQRVAQLEQQRQAAPGAQYTDPSRERAKRELIARGYDPDLNAGRYLEYQKSPYYKAMIGADDILTDILAGEQELQAVTKPQRLAADLVRQMDTAGKAYTIKDLEKQLGKVLKGDELQAALSFALAAKEYEAQNLSNPSQRELQRAAQQREGQREEAAKAADAAITQQLEQELDQQALFMQRLQKSATPEQALMQQWAGDVFRQKAAAPVAAPQPEERVSMELGEEVVPLAQVDPSDPRYSYRKVDEGYEVTRTDLPERAPSIARPGTRAFRSIEGVLAGREPLAQAAPAPAPAAPAPTVEAPAGEAEAPPKRYVYDPATGQFVPQ